MSWLTWVMIAGWDCAERTEVRHVRLIIVGPRALSRKKPGTTLLKPWIAKQRPLFSGLLTLEVVASRGLSLPRRQESQRVPGRTRSESLRQALHPIGMLVSIMR
jgi:hypothetical protein